MKNKQHKGTCLCCPKTTDVLNMDTVLYNGFGGYAVYLDRELFYQGDSNGDFDSFLTLSDIEKVVNEKPRGEWKVVLDNPLRGATWLRNMEGKWELIETNQGFA